MTLADAVILLLAVLAVGTAVSIRIKNAKHGCCGTGGKCSGCRNGSCDKCHKKAK